MKAYILRNYYYDHEEYSSGEFLLGVYGTRASAESAREEHIKDYISEILDLGYGIERSQDYFFDPVINKMDYDNIIVSNTFKISEHEVQ